MTKTEFNEYIKDRFVFLDGATGSNLVKKGMPSGVCPEMWILKHQDVLRELQNAYIEAGSNIIYAPTFTANRIKLKEYGLEKDIVSINSELIKLSKDIAGGRALVAGDITMTGLQLKPIGPLDFEELVDVYKEQIKIIADAGADLIVVETMMSLQETRCALIAAKEVCDLPVICTLTFEKDGRTLFGSDAITSAVVLESLGASAVGANCSSGPSEMASVIKAMADNIDIPVIAKPNAGMPSLDSDGNTVYDMDEETFSKEALKLIESGASILGGCCGTSPSYIKALKNAVSGREPLKHGKDKGIRYITSERKTLKFSLDDPFIVVGERINPTGKKKLQAELKEGKLDIVHQYTEEQEEMGASILDINVGMGGIDEKEMMLKVLLDVSNLTSLPLSVDTSSPEVLREALRRYPGRSLVNSVSAESAVMEEKLKIAKEYGAMIIVLPLSDEGLPKSFDEKLKNLEHILSYAYELGFKKEDIVVDGLVSTIGANKNAAKEVLETIRYAYENGLATTCGLSNISFGLPERMFVNTAFLTMAVEAGLSMAIMNPSQQMLMNAAFSADLLKNKAGADIRYIERMNNLETIPQTQTVVKAVKKDDTSVSNAASSNEIDDIIYNDVLKGNKDSIVLHTKERIESGSAPESILNDLLMPAIDEVGRRFNSGKYFLPQLIGSAESMKLSIEYLEQFLDKASNEELGTIVIATVKGDIHDIGKNLVSMMLKNHGFRVYDLGKDVSREEIIDKAKEYSADIICLSALMTTTMTEMKNVIEYAKSNDVKAKIMVGGAVITKDYSEEIGADGYSKDAAEAVIVAKELLNIV